MVRPKKQHGHGTTTRSMIEAEPVWEVCMGADTSSLSENGTEKAMS